MAIAQPTGIIAQMIELCDCCAVHRDSFISNYDSHAVVEERYIS
jgi:hypothetical protein